ncbi:NADH dehydrogenase 1 alpha subcomplex subunit 6 NDUFA6 [Phycomyces blakesleeanus]|uniref:NADH dehydrogenase 1 alpha subcomplex subunit 6 NDUFA6 n=2 Tax=Phycomyces blakesleeanus TaxID=4837 RepID=A0A162XYF2_PHYB8|nr:NADH dehydrogenase 1 alpha subcomplex subunit 6 NDUFA6 [Phycomyces blakesleeanus NRRL 1555(-)]OAD77285.1 NADH dehydrogenase 1 alpha subcomplex subunit 6 NDUFA6 [Phycomyces blakesleeanus NRRL 1555(-)]|eukprot:XP_018295325.1 NADH dehydrogenase 1 alpha subcomplex subunit 6 NDUFA6 [Phycomyces blakesleeanus NRRL 1555(-)]
MSSSAHVLSLYRNFIRFGNRFQSYNFKDYTIRRARDAFHENKLETDPSKITQFIRKAEHDLEVVKRQAAISTLYATGDRLVIEKAPRRH